MLLLLSQAKESNLRLMKHNNPVPCRTCCKARHSSFHSTSNKLQLWLLLQMLPAEWVMQSLLWAVIQCHHLLLPTILQQTLAQRP